MNEDEPIFTIYMEDGKRFDIFPNSKITRFPGKIKIINNGVVTLWQYAQGLRIKLLKTNKKAT